MAILSNKDCVEIVDKYYPMFIKYLHMKKYKINLHVVRSTSKEFKKYKIKYNKEYGLSFSADDCGDLFIFSDRHSSAKNLICTLFHELLHIKIYKLANLITFNCEKAHREEEKLVRDLEYFFRKTNNLRL